MNYLQPYRLNEINWSQLVYPKIISKTDKKIILVKYNDKGKTRPLVFQSPTLLNIHEPIINSGYGEIEVAMVGKEENKIEQFLEFLNNLENKIKQDAQFNAVSWFNLIENNKIINFQKIVRESEEYINGTIKLKLIKNNDFETVLQMENSKRLSLDNVPAQSWIKTLLEVYAIWVKPNNDFGIFLRPILASFTPKEKEIYNYNFLDDSDDECPDIPDTENSNNLFINVNKKTTNDELTSSLNLNEVINYKEQSSESNLVKLNLISDKSYSSSSSNDENNCSDECSISSEKDEEENSETSIDHLSDTPVPDIDDETSDN